MWRMPNGAYITDSDRNFLSIASEVGDAKRIKTLRDTVKSFGIDEGSPVFFAGHRKISDEEYESQLTRAKLGLVPDTEDVSALIDDLKRKPQ